MQVAVTVLAQGFNLLDMPVRFDPSRAQECRYAMLKERKGFAEWPAWKRSFALHRAQLRAMERERWNGTLPTIALPDLEADTQGVSNLQLLRDVRLARAELHRLHCCRSVLPISLNVVARVAYYSVALHGDFVNIRCPMRQKR